MSTQQPTIIRATLDTTTLDDQAREKLVSAILALAPQSPLYANNPVIQKAVQSLDATFTAYKDAGKTAASSAKQAEIDTAACVTAKKANSKALTLLRTLVEHQAQSPDDLQSMAFDPRGERPPSPEVIPPDSIEITPYRKGTGKARVSAHETGKAKNRYAAESSTEPAAPTTWSTLPGTGKSRVVAGKSGDNVWVRFALVRGRQQSEWSTPVLVTLP